MEREDEGREWRWRMRVGSGEGGRWVHDGGDGTHKKLAGLRVVLLFHLQLSLFHSALFT